MPTIALFLKKKKNVKISECGWELRPQTPSEPQTPVLLLTLIASVTKLSKRAILTSVGYVYFVQGQNITIEYYRKCSAFAFGPIFYFTNPNLYFYLMGHMVVWFYLPCAGHPRCVTGCLLAKVTNNK